MVAGRIAMATAAYHVATLACVAVLQGAQPAQAQVGGEIPEWYGRFVAVKEFAGTFTISFDYSTTSDPDGSYPIWQGTERWSVGGTLRLQQTADLPNAWKGDGEASMRVDVDTLTGGQAGVVYRDSLHAAGRTRLATETFPAQLAIVTDGRYWISFGMPELVAHESWTRLDSGETRSATPRVTIFAQAQDVPVPERGQRLRGRQEISLSEGGRIGMVPFDWVSWVRLWPRDPARAPKAVVTWDLAPVVREYRLEVEIPDHADWFPKAGLDERAPGADLTARARLVESDGGEVTAGVVKTVLFELEDVSREPGVAMNWPPPARATRDPDLRFDRDRNFDLPNWVSSDERSVEVRGEVEEPEVVLTSYDWGAHAFLRVSAELQDGRTVYGALKEDPARLRIPVPKRRDGSRIAEHFRPRIGDRRDDEDEEDQPPGEGTRGDGLTVYQEYRGFHENGEHIRGDLARKDLFVSLGVGLVGYPEAGIQRFAQQSGLNVHYRLMDDELGDDEIIDPNQSAAGAHHQHGLRMVRENISITGGRAIPRDSNLRRFTSPGDVDRIAIDTELGPRTVSRGGGYRVDPHYSRVVAHELGHSVGIAHHGVGDRKVTWAVAANGALTENGAPIQLLREDGTPLRFPSLAQPLTINLGAWGGEHSGDQGCFMRYVDSHAYRANTQGNLRYWTNGEPLGGGLCSAQAGTGVNDGNRTPQPRYGPASEGSCKARIRVRDP